MINVCNVPDVWLVEIDTRYTLPAWIELANGGSWSSGDGITFTSGYFAKVKLDTGPVTLTSWGLDVHVEVLPGSGVVSFGLFHGADEFYGAAIDQFNSDISRVYNAQVSVSDNFGFNIWATRNPYTHVAYIQKIRLVGVGVNPFI